MVDCLQPTAADRVIDRAAGIGDGTARLAAMNPILHGIGKPTGQSIIEATDALLADPERRYSVVLSNPPLRRKSSITMVGADGREAREDREIERADASPEDLDALPAPEVIAREIVDDLTAALAEFEAVATAL